jgi:hypothetical protein
VITGGGAIVPRPISSSVLESGFKPDSLVYTYLFDHMYTEFLLVQNSTCDGFSGT